ncbi:hypothetical protein [Nonomuraea rhizosphaerae]|uniref:hypothetical protein n=1 Tax=Nonomuraea rhizosphaerae TaxID=2665663 RepID=UPI001C5E8D93|nr:hypothetical protein [Nonomuraea rhizosphaerae]
MGRHGTGGSDDADDWGDDGPDNSQEQDPRYSTDPAARWAAVPDPTAKSAFWGPDDQESEPPGWPSLPDQIEVTGHWAPMPKREGGPAGPAPDKRPDPFETTGAFAPPPRSQASGRPPEPARGDAPMNVFMRPEGRGAPEGPSETTGAFMAADGLNRPQPSAGPTGAGPFETTGAFNRPAQWDGTPGDEPGANETRDFNEPFGSTQVFATGDVIIEPAGGGPGMGGPSGPFRLGVGTAGSGGPGSGGPGQVGPGPGDSGPGGPGGPGRPGFGPDGPAFGGPAFGGPGPDGPAFGDPGGPGPGGPGFGDPAFGGPSGPTGPGGAAFGGPGPDGPGFGGQGPGGEGPGGFPSDPPEPGDIKVYGSPTMVDASAPAWAESPDNGFLGSGWSSDEPADEEPRRRRGRRKDADHDVLGPPPGGGGGRAKVALLSVAAVAVVLGGTVAGVKFMSSSKGAADCAGSSCAAVAVTNQPGAKVTESAPADEEPTEEPADEPSEEDTKASDSPKPTATVGPRTTRRTASPTPTPTRTKTKQAKPTDDPFPTATEEATATEEPTDESTTINDPNTGGRPTDAVTAEPVPTATVQARSGAGGQAVNLDFNVVDQGLTTYTAHLDVVNSSSDALSSLTVSLPIRGRVLSVTGGEWNQDGDLLIIDMPESLDTGGSTQLTIRATGRGVAPANCGLVGGDCAVN